MKLTPTPLGLVENEVSSSLGELSENLPLKEIRYVSIDLETTGLDPESCQIIQFAAVLDDFVTPVDLLPKLELLVTQSDNLYLFQPHAAIMHSHLMSKIIEGTSDSCEEDNLYFRFLEFLRANNWSGETLTLAGKNLAKFDIPFLDELEFFTREIKIHHRIFDPGNMFWKASDGSVLPNTEECMRRCGLKGSPEHTALADALAVVRMIRYKYGQTR